MRAQVANGEGVAAFEVRMLTGAGDYLWVAGRTGPARDAAGAVVGRITMLHDIHEQVNARAQARESEQRFRILAENATDVVWQLNPDDILTWVSPAVEHVLGWAPHDLVGRPVVDLIHPDDQEPTAAWKAALRRGVDPGPLESRRLHADGSYRWLSLHGHPITDAGAATGGLVVGMSDIGDEVATRSALSHALAHDPLTGLPTMAALLPRIDRLLNDSTTEIPARTVAVLCIGVDGLKPVNEALTNAAGDRLLTTVATRLAAASNTDLLARGSGDEFIAVAGHLLNGADAGQLADAICDAIHGPVDIGSHTIEPSVSIGIATVDGAQNGEQLIRDASLAMHQAKDNGRDRWEFFLATQAHEATHRLDVEDGIRAGLAHGEFVAWLQPIVNLDTIGTVGYEALVRWVRRDGTVTSPAQFLPVAERSHLIVDVDTAVLTHTLTLLPTLAGHTYVSVNVSAATLTQPDYAAQVLDLLTRTHTDPQRLHLEITETAVLSTTATATVRHTMEQLVFCV